MSGGVGMRQQARTRMGSVGWPAAIGVTLVVVVTILGSAIEGVGGLAEAQLPIELFLLQLGGVALLVGAAWATSAHRPPVSLGLAITASAITLPVWAGWPSLADPLRASVLAVAPLAVAGTAQVALQWSRDNARSSALRTVFALAAVAAIVHVLAFNPSREPGCNRLCVHVQPLASGLLDTRSAVAISGMASIAAAAVALLALVAARPPDTPRPIAVAAAASLVLLSAVPALRWVRWFDPQSIESLLVLPYCAGALLGSAVVIEVSRAWRTRAEVVRLLSRLSEGGTGPEDFDGMIEEVQFAVPGDGRWVDSMGRPASEPSHNRQCVYVSDSSGPVVRLFVSPKRDAGDVLAALTPAARLSLGNAQLIAETRAHVAEIQASRRRIVATADAENRRIERDLHDGAQQRLVSAALYLRLAHGRSGEHVPQLSAAEESLRVALAHLRRLAHGMFPGVLVQAGLRSALDEVVRTAHLPATLQVQGDIDVEESASLAAYALVAAALEQGTREPGATGAAVSARRAPGLLELRVELVGGDPSALDFTDAGDRIGALGGTLTVTRTSGGADVTAGLPCA